MIYSLKNQSRSPLTPPGSPPMTERARTLTRVPFHLRRSSLTPVTSPTRAPLVHDGSYLQALGLRLNEAVSKALAQPSGPSQPRELVGGRRPIPPGRGRAVGDIVAFELQAARDNRHLYRAILRALQKPLSVLLSNLSALLLPLLSSPAFLQSSVPTIQNATQHHALAIADFAGELLSSFDELRLGVDADGRGDGLHSIRTGLVSLIGRVTTPLISGVKEALIPLLNGLEISPQTTPRKAKGLVHPSISALQSSIPAYGQALARYASIYHSDTLLASFLISIVWRALVALSHRPVAQGSMLVVLSEKGQFPSLPRTPSASSTAGLFNFKRGSSRPTSPTITSTVVADAKALYEIFTHFPRPTHTQVAREAVDEAFAHLEALVALLEIAEDPSFLVNKTVEEIADEIRGLTDELPTLIALPVLLRMQYFGSALGPQASSIVTLLNISEDTYRKDCLAGFGRAEQCGPAVAQQILDAMCVHPVVDSSDCLVDWLVSRLCECEH